MPVDDGPGHELRNSSRETEIGIAGKALTAGKRPARATDYPYRRSLQPPPVNRNPPR